jgi:hypothetical protein
MELTFLYSPGFVREWDRQRLTDADLPFLEEEIAKGRTSAPLMRGTGGLRKIRFAPPSRHVGKSGAMRVGFAYFQMKAAIIVVAIFSKNESSNFSAAERTEIAKWLKQVERSFR